MAVTPNTVAHFAVNVDDMDAAQAFYAAAFGWTFAPWGPPGFFKISTPAGEQPGPIGAMQGRRDLGDGVRVTGFECTVAVDDVEAAVAAAVAAGGTVLMAPVDIPTVGRLAWLADPSGNPVGAMQFAPDAA